MILQIATIPRRRWMVEALLEAVAKQTAVPEQIHLILDGYEGLPSPTYPTLPVIEHRMPTTGGPGGRWRIVKQISRDAILINLDDDQQLMSVDVLSTLVKFVEHGGVASYMGMTPSGLGGVLSTGRELISIASGVLAMHASYLDGLDVTYAEIKEKCGFDPFGARGDDDAVLSTHFWRKKIPMYATGPLAVSTAPGSQNGGQLQQRQAEGRPLFWQRVEIARATGWPWR